MANRWLAGAAQVDITPPLGVGMSGYANRPSGVTEIYDPLFARALAISDGERTAALVSADLLVLSGAHVERVRERLAEAAGIPPELLLLNASHTHAGPATAPLRAMGPCDPEYCAVVPRRIASTVELAVRRLAPAQLSCGTATTGIGINRRETRAGRLVLGLNPGGAYDQTVHVLRVDDPVGAPRAIWFSHATHPVVMGQQNTGVSAEWPGAACAALTQVLGQECVPLFAQGCAGDINPRRRGGIEVVRSVGRELAGAALAAIERAEPLLETGVAGAREVVDLPQRAPTAEEGDAAIAEMDERLAGARAAIAAGERPPYEIILAEAMAGWARDYRAAAEVPPPACSLEMQALRIGELVLIATAGETFLEIGQQLQQACPLPGAVALGYTNGCVGYLPTARAFDQGGYEVDTAFRYYGTLMVTSDCERLIVESAVPLMARVTA